MIGRRLIGHRLIGHSLIGHHLIGRRTLLATLGATALGPRPAHAALPVPVPEGNRLSFRVLRGDSAIGTHVLYFDPHDDILDVRSEVDLRVGFGPFTLFRYTLRSTERWTAGAFETLDATTNDNGTQDFARIKRDADGLWVEGSQAPRYLAPPNALPSSHWNKAELDGPWINPQDGKLLHPVVAQLGVGDVPAANGPPIAATQYALSGDVQMHLWYDSTPSWVALHFTAHDGSLIRYERM